jgi:hypothetical protein
VEAAMLHSLRAFFSNLSSWLIVLKYLGLSLAAGSSVWGTINELTTKTVDGRKQLTTAGAVAIVLTILGLVVSIVSEDMQRREAASSQKAQVAAEAKRTNEIIISGQPLRSLEVDWAFQGLDADLLQKLQKGNDDAVAYIEDQQGERDSEQNGAVFREHQLYPFLLTVSRRFAGDKAKQTDPNVVVLIALDDDQNSVLPFGFLGEAKKWYDGSEKNGKGPNSPSVEVGSHAYYGNDELLSWPNLEVSKSNAVITWRVDPSAFAKSLNRQNEFIVPTASLPSVLRIAVLFDISALPFKAGNFALARDQGFWKFPDDVDSQNDNFRGKVDLITKNFSSSVRLVPNGSPIIAYSYRLNQVYETLFLDTYGEADSDIRCLVFEYKVES